MIGEIIQHILDKGFSIIYTYDNTHYGNHIIRIKKYCGEKVFSNQWAISDLDIASLNSKQVLLDEADYRMKQVDEAVTQCRLIEEALR